MAFEALWIDLLDRLGTGSEVRGWSREKRDTKLRFRVVDSGPDAIVIASQPLRGKPKPTARRIGKADLQRVYALWQEYWQGKIGRAEMTKISQNTSYIFTLLRWRENQTGRAHNKS